MKEEMNSLLKNKTWQLVKRPQEQRIVGCKWIYKLKADSSSDSNVKYKARLVAKGFTQVEGVDFHEIFSPVVKHCSIRQMLTMVTQMDMELEQLDVKTAFLHGELEETIFMDQPEGFVTKDNSNDVCLLKKSLYGLKQSPRQWNKRLNEFMLNISFNRSSFDSCIYIKAGSNNSRTFLLLYADDMLIASTSNQELQELKFLLKSEFEMKELGEARRILGMKIMRDRERKSLFLN